MINRRQFAKGTASALVALQNPSLLAAANDLAFAPDLQVSEFYLHDYLRLYDFPEELLSYPLSFAAGTVKKDSLRLFQKGSKDPVAIQFTDVQETDGFLRCATLYFRADLKRGEQKSFSLVQNSETPSPVAELISTQAIGEDRVAITANQLQILVPSIGSHALNVPVSQAPAPLLAIARETGKWVGAGRLVGPDSLVVQAIDARIVEQGPLFLKYAIQYTLSGDRSYKVELTVQSNETYVAIDEYTTSISPGDRLDFQFSYKQGVDPNGRLLMANGGYSTGGPQQGASGAYDEKANSKGMLPIKLGIYTPNSINLPRAIAFWNDSGENAILFALRRLPDWQTSQRALWSVNTLPDNLEFYAQPGNGDEYLRAPVVSKERYWAVALIPRDAMIVRGWTMGDMQKTPRPAEHVWKVDSSMNGLISYGAGPEVRLLQKLNDFSLNRYKDCIFEFQEDSRTTSFNLPHTDIAPTTMTGIEYLRNYIRNFEFLAQVGWDFSSEMGANHWGWSIHPESINYAFNCSKWTAKERLQARSWLVLTAYLMELDTAMPQSSMLGGHPNFAAEYKAVLGVVAGLFPLHPHACRWRDTYLSFWTEYLDRYVRKGNPETGSKPGRFTESIACYSYASMEAICMAATGLKLLDGTQLLDRPAFCDWMRWDMESRLPFRVEGARIVPPQGAHASTSILSLGGRWYNTSRQLALMLKDTAPELADQMLWTLTNGAEGKLPTALQSQVFADYGPVLRYDFGGANEAYLNLQQLNGIGYRWSSTSNGTLYFAAKGKVWSWNRIEANGDNLDISLLSDLQAGQSSLGASLASEVLYNFDFAQYYRAAAINQNGNSPYRSRGVVMVRGDYVAVHDEIESGVAGKFNWANEGNGLVWEIFSDKDFQKPLKSFINDERFPLMLTDDQMRYFTLPESDFSIRSNGQFLVPVAGRYKFRTTWNTYTQNVPVEDTMRLYLDDIKIFDNNGPGLAEVELEARSYALHFEYVHASSKPPFLSLAWVRPDKPSFGQIDNSNFGTQNQMPFIHQVQGGPGNQLHVIAPQKLEVAPAAFDGIRIDNAEFVLFSDASVAEEGKQLRFSGKAGYASEGAVALFEGTHIEMNGLGLSRSDGDFGASVKLTSSRSIEVHVAGRTGGTLRIHLPKRFAASGLKGRLDGNDVSIMMEGSTLAMPITIQQGDGVKTYIITR